MNAASLAAFHLVALAAPWTHTSAGLWTFVTLTLLTSLFGVVIGFHRLLSHRSFEAPRAVGYSLALLGTLAGQAGPLRWAAMHRFHHANADTPRDLHSPSHGLLWSYLGWTCFDDEVNPEELVPDLYCMPFHRFLERRRGEILVASALALSGAGLLAGGPQLAASLFVWGFVLRVLYCWHLIFLVNAVGHLRGPRAFPTPDQSANVAWLALPSYGDAWHNNHHADPSSARLGRDWRELDVAYAVIALMERAGLARNVRRIGTSAVPATRHRIAHSGPAD
jgi:stearoyl-CoA desaturase (delta-9 desaturase)